MPQRRQVVSDGRDENQAMSGETTNQNSANDTPLRGQLPPEWTTRRVAVHDAAADDAPALTAIFNACTYVQPWDPTFHPVELPEIGQVVERSLADDEHANFRLQAVRPRDGGQPFGYFHLFHGAPQPDVCWISMFVIHPDYQGQHLAQEVINGLAYYLRQAGYRAIWLEVYLRNWPALRFWTIMGFTTIVGYEGDKEPGEGRQARLMLERPLADL